METYAQGAIKPESIIGKPLVVYIDGERIEIGTITHAAVRGDKLYFGAKFSLSEETAEDFTALIEQNV